MKRVIVSEKGEGFLKAGQPWMYRNNLVSADGCSDGDPVSIFSETGEFIASGFYSAVSHIAVRILASHQEELDEAFFEARLRTAIDYRRTIMGDNFDNCRMVYGEADGLSGLLADRYNDTLVTQITAAGFEQRREMVYGLLLKLLKDDGVAYIYERNDLKAREKEGLPLYQGFFGPKGETVKLISENGLKLEVDIENGQKTGYFLDQKSNRLLIRGIAAGKKVLDCFSHTGGFALNAALGNAAQVTAVDISMTALEQAKRNAGHNALTNITFQQADVFAYLDTLKQGDYDLIILDPPAFTKSRRTVDHAYQGYLSINARAMNLLRKDGYLATCSCSRYMETALFEEMLKEATEKEQVILRQISVTQQNGDHPILWQRDETSYLKFYIFQVVERF
ncbi:MAG: class I SAM-dependent rRNA methyltransferase [Solobacterium sp.]|nr:class I SAM-dependent rRNA methyltransferase [Solobacterium sp.]